VGEREKEEKRLQQSREILSMDTGPFHSNIHGIRPFQLNKLLYICLTTNKIFSFAQEVKIHISMFDLYIFE
jgi:hypothetical protein